MSSLDKLASRLGWPRILVVCVLYGVPILTFVIVGVAIWASIDQVDTTQVYPYISDIARIRLYDKIFIREFLIANPCDIIQLYTNFLYDYRCDLFRYGFYDDLFSCWVNESTHLVNYDCSFLSTNRLAVKALIINHILTLDPQPVGYFYRTFFLSGFEALTGVPFMLGVHDGEVWGIVLSTDLGNWNLYTGRNPFVEGLSFKATPINGSSYRIIDLIYYTPVVEDYKGPMALDDRIRVFSLRCRELELTPAKPVIVYPKEPPTFSRV